MGRLIDADALVAEFKQLSLGENSLIERIFADGVYAVIETAPTVDAVPVVHGKWLKDGDFLICLNCESEINIKNSLGVENKKNYCPNCGATMDLERSEDEKAD